MRLERYLRIFHIIVTVQFTVSAGLVIFWSLYTSKLNWWAIFSLSTQGVVLLGLGAFIYAFAVFCGSVGERIPEEHPLTGSIYYRLFYLVVPVAAGLSCGADYLVTAGPLEGLRGLAFGTVLSAYAIWLFLDPVAGIIELSIPGNRRIRRRRLDEAKEKREARERQKAQLLEELTRRHNAKIANLQPVIARHAQRLSDLLTASLHNPRRGYDEAASIGLEVWQAGGMEAMKALYAAALGASGDNGTARQASYLDYWWDGIGGWHQGEVEVSPDVFLAHS